MLYLKSAALAEEKISNISGNVNENGYSYYA
jgi:hypothetical protein